MERKGKQNTNGLGESVQHSIKALLSLAQGYTWALLMSNSAQLKYIMKMLIEYQKKQITTRTRTHINTHTYMCMCA